SEERYSISNITIIAIEPTPGWKDACHNRALKDLGHPCLSMRTAGDAVTVEACIKLPLPLDTINSPWTGFSILSGQFSMPHHLFGDGGSVISMPRLSNSP